VIERFNFYDVYGYFVPGCSLFALLWLPYGVATRSWPSTELGSALAAIIFAYIVGHFLQILSTNALPSKIEDKSGNIRYPSQVFLDSENTAFSTEFKERLAQLVQSDFGLDLAVGKSPNGQNDEEFFPIDRRRQNAFFLCRGTLIREKIAAYPEQFEGMYTLLRGLATACLLAAVYCLGWSSATCRARWTTRVAVGILIFGLCYCLVCALIIVLRKPRKLPLWVDRAFLVAFSLPFVGSGHLLGLAYIHSRHLAQLFAGIAVLLLVLALKFFTAYKTFAENFAKAVWQDYVGRGKASA
jgi:hypothetical protein